MMSDKELIEQLAKEQGLRKYSGIFPDEYIVRAHELEAFAKAYAQTQGQSNPDGWKLVPIEPTEEMLEALADLVFENASDAECYRAMLNAAPIESGVKG